MVLILVSVIFLSMVYHRFFKAKENSAAAPSPGQQTTQSRIAPPVQAKTPPMDSSPGVSPEADAVTNPVLIPFNPDIRNIFTPSDAARTALEKESQISAALSSLSEKSAKTERHPLSDQEKVNIRQALRFKGSIISQGRALAIINGEFVHVGDRINGYKVTSITEKKAFINTGRGILALELMTHD